MRARRPSPGLPYASGVTGLQSLQRSLTLQRVTQLKSQLTELSRKEAREVEGGTRGVSRRARSGGRRARGATPSQSQSRKANS